jgi:hypothetical protein
MPATKRHTAGISSHIVTRIMASSIEARLAAVEAILGVLPLGAPTGKNAVAGRFKAIQSAMDSHTTSQFRDTWQESDKLFRELDPGIALTHQQQPLLYRRQEILASADTMQKDMEELRKILHLLLLTSQPSSGPLREDQVTQAPIITGTSISPEGEHRMDALRLSLADLNTRTTQLVEKMDNILECYHAIISAASEKCVLADEAIGLREEQSQPQREDD